LLYSAWPQEARTGSEQYKEQRNGSKLLLLKRRTTASRRVKRCRELEKGWALFTDAVCPNPAVVVIVGIVVIKAFPYPSRFGIGMDIPQGIQHSPVVFGVDRKGNNFLGLN